MVAEPSAMIIPGPGLFAILFSTIRVLWEIAPPSAILHYTLWLIKFF